MAKSNIIKLVATIMVIELIMVNVGATATHNNGGYGKKISLGCIATCAVTCAASEEFMPICMAACLLTCSGADSPVVKNCTFACARSTCSKYIGSDVKTVEHCVADECVEKCLSGA